MPCYIGYVVLISVEKSGVTYQLSLSQIFVLLSRGLLKYFTEDLFLKVSQFNTKNINFFGGQKESVKIISN